MCSFSFKDLLIELGVCKLHLECVRELFTEAPPQIEKVIPPLIITLFMIHLGSMEWYSKEI